VDTASQPTQPGLRVQAGCQACTRKARTGMHAQHKRRQAGRQESARASCDKCLLKWAARVAAARPDPVHAVPSGSARSTGRCGGGHAPPPEAAREQGIITAVSAVTPPWRPYATRRQARSTVERVKHEVVSTCQTATRAACQRSPARRSPRGSQPPKEEPLADRRLGGGAGSAVGQAPWAARGSPQWLQVGTHRQAAFPARWHAGEPS
jgi:hypothetical protein